MTTQLQLINIIIIIIIIIIIYLLNWFNTKEDTVQILSEPITFTHKQ